MTGDFRRARSDRLFRFRNTSFGGPRTLRLNPKWENASGEWRIGIKRAYELFPKSLVTRVKAERRKEWDKKHLAAEVISFHVKV